MAKNQPVSCEECGNTTITIVGMELQKHVISQVDRNTSLPEVIHEELTFQKDYRCEMHLRVIIVITRKSQRTS